MEFTILRALQLSFRSWFRNVVPFTLLVAALYAPAIVWVATADFESAGSVIGLFDAAFMWPLYAVTGLAMLLAPMLTHRVIQELNGVRVSMLTSMKHGVRGIAPALAVAIAIAVLNRIPGGAFLAAIVACVCFVAAPAAVAERVGTFESLARSTELTRGRRWGIFALTILMQLALALPLLIWFVPRFGEPDAVLLADLRPMALAFVCTTGFLRMFSGIVEAVSYALLRQDKDGVSPEQLARVFE